MRAPVAVAPPEADLPGSRALWTPDQAPELTERVLDSDMTGAARPAASSSPGAPRGRP
jgi:hypothetical protein